MVGRVLDWITVIAGACFLSIALTQVVLVNPTLIQEATGIISLAVILIVVFKTYSEDPKHVTEFLVVSAGLFLAVALLISMVWESLLVTSLSLPLPNGNEIFINPVTALGALVVLFVTYQAVFISAARRDQRLPESDEQNSSF